MVVAIILETCSASAVVEKRKLVTWVTVTFILDPFSRIPLWYDILLVFIKNCFIVCMCVLMCNFVSYFVCNFVYFVFLCDILLPSGVINDD